MSLRKHATSIVLALLAAGIGAYAYIDRGSVTETEKKLREGTLFPAWRREDLSRIELANRGGDTIILERVTGDGGDSSWFLRSPRSERADDAVVQKLLATLEFATALRKVDVDAASTVGGLDAPRLQASITMGPVVYRFAIGGEAPSPAGASYLRYDGGVVVVSRDLVTELLKPVDAYRTRSIVPYLSIELAKLEITSSHGSLALTRADDVSFRLPDGMRVSRGAIDKVWSALAETRAEAFVSDADADRATANPVITIRMSPTLKVANEAGILVIGDVCPGHPDDVVVVRKAPTRLSACAPKGILAGLETPAESLVDTHLFVSHDDEVTEAKLETLPLGNAPAAKLEIARKTNGWHERSPVDRDLGPDEVDAANALASDLARTEGGYPKKDPAPFEARGRITVTNADGAIEIVELGAPNASGDRAARRSFDGAILQVSAATARKLVPRATSLRGREVWDPPIDGKNAETVSTACGDVVQSIAKSGDAWRMTAPIASDADNVLRLNVIDAVTRLRADAWVADADDGTFGFDVPCAIALRVTMDGGPSEKRVFLGKEGEGGIYARIEGDAAVLVAPKDLRDLARTWLVARPRLTEKIAEFARPIAITIRGKTRTLRGPPDKELPDPIVSDAEILDDLGQVMLESAIHLGPARESEGFAAPRLDLKIGGDGPLRLRIGAETNRGEIKGYFARADGIEATFFVPRLHVDAVLDRLASSGNRPDRRDR